MSMLTPSHPSDLHLPPKSSGNSSLLPEREAPDLCPQSSHVLPKHIPVGFTANGICHPIGPSSMKVDPEHVLEPTVSPGLAYNKCTQVFMK